MESTYKNLTAIIADDEPSILRGLHENINWSALGIEILETAIDGKMALNSIQTLKPDLAIIDIHMPHLSGLDVIKQCKSASITTDFIILSGYNDFKYAQDAIRLGAKSYLLKPLKLDDLKDEISRIRSEKENDQLNNYKEEFEYSNTSNLTFFNNLVHYKKLTTEYIESVLSSSKVNLTNRESYVFVFSYKAYSKEELSNIDFTSILTKLNTALGTLPHKIWHYDEQTLLGIFNTNPKSHIEIAKLCLDTLTSFHLPLPLIGIGDQVKSLLETSFSYNRALTSISYRLYDNTGRIFSSEIICSTPPLLKLSDIDYLPLIQYIVKHDLSGIKVYSKTFLNRILYVKMPPPNYVFSLCYALYNMIEREFSSFSKEDVAENANPHILYACTSLSQIEDWLIHSFSHLSKFVDAVYGYGGSSSDSSDRIDPDDLDELSTIDDPIIKSAQIYIKENIHQSLKIESIAKHIHLSPSYFAIYFKNKTHRNLRDYLLEQKMKYAKEKLKDPQAMISNLAYDLGYCDYRSFSRAFKNVHGITPSEYQSQLTDEK